VKETDQYDNLNALLTRQKVIKGGNNLLDLSYDYAKNNSVGTGTGKTGHLTKTTDNLNNAKNKEYEFDALGRLTKAKGGVQSTNFSWQQTYSYDRFGNRLNVVATGNGIDGQPMQKDGIGNLTYDNLTNRITNSGYQFDVAGNQTRSLAEDGVTWLKYEYDAANRLQVIRKDSDNSVLEAFQFGSTNQRLMKTDYALGQTTIYSGDVEYTEYVSAIMTWTKSYVRLGDSILSTITPNGSGGETTEFNHPDRLGTRIVTNQTTGTSTEQASLPFGTALGSETSRSESKRFTSYDRSVRTGLDYAINRTYDSKLGRFTQVDPIKMRSVSLVAPQTLNLYGYCGNDPINHTDASGLFWGFIKKLFKWAMVVVTVVIAVIAIATFNIPAGAGFIKGLIAILGLVSKIAQAASEILNALGYKKAGRIFGIIGDITATFGNILSQRRNAARTPPFNGFSGGDDEEDGIIYVYTFEKKSWWGWFTGLFSSSSGDRPGFPLRTPVNDLSKLRPEIQNCITQVEAKYGKEFSDKLAEIKSRDNKILVEAVGGGTVAGAAGALAGRGGLAGGLITSGGRLGAGAAGQIYDHQVARATFLEKLKGCGVQPDWNKGKNYYRRIKGIG
jgi:RHS repeat-associated protein